MILTLSVLFSLSFTLASYLFATTLTYQHISPKCLLIPSEISLTYFIDDLTLHLKTQNSNLPDHSLSMMTFLDYDLPPSSATQIDLTKKNTLGGSEQSSTSSFAIHITIYAFRGYKLTRLEGMTTDLAYTLQPPDPPVCQPGRK